MLVMGRGLAFALLLACGHSGNVIPAALTTAGAVGASLISRDYGGCYGICGSGLQCNHETGMCDPIPCRGQCPSDEVCEVTHKGEHCVPASLAVPGPSCTPVPDAGSLLVVTCSGR
jgi:hypothetical protein